jgi:probable F420-dependent oxidoreductase
MKINVTLPFDQIENPEEFLQPGSVTQIATLLERLGFEGACATDHPCPTGRWLDAGGHYAQDPFVMLSFVAAATRKLRLHTGILVLPYRNPFITARAIATLDVFSGGRVTVGVGAGYLKGEYRALGVDFDRRNELMDEYIRAIKAAWTSDEFTFEGSGYQALGNRILPRPSQKPHRCVPVSSGQSRSARDMTTSEAVGSYPIRQGSRGIGPGLSGRHFSDSRLPHMDANEDNRKESKSPPPPGHQPPPPEVHGAVRTSRRHAELAKRDIERQRYPGKLRTLKLVVATLTARPRERALAHLAIPNTPTPAEQCTQSGRHARSPVSNSPPDRPPCRLASSRSAPVSA